MWEKVAAGSGIPEIKVAWVVCVCVSVRERERGSECVSSVCVSV